MKLIKLVRIGFAVYTIHKMFTDPQKQEEVNLIAQKIRERTR